MRIFAFSLLCVLTQASTAAPGYSVWGEFKYAPGFKHFDYVNPNAPKGGELRLIAGSRISTFDKYNPFTMKGTAPSFLTTMLFEGLLTASMDEVGVGYGLLAEDVDVAADRLSVVFKLRPEARFNNGDAVTASDVKHSYDMLISKFALPAYSTLLAEVAGCDVLDERTVRFRFKKNDKQLPLVVGALPVFSPKWGQEAGKVKTFDLVVTDVPVASGAYKIGPVRFGKDITYARDPNYWGRNLPVNIGTNNFDRITVKIYRDGTAQLEALKGGEFDLMEFFSAGDWTRRLTGPRIDKGELIKSPFNHRTPDGYYSYVLNNRLDKFKDRRVRIALELAMDYEWMNRQMFRSSYKRVKGIFGNTDCEAHGVPPPQEIALLEPFRKELHADTFGTMALPPRTDGNNSLRENLRRARTMLKEAGWEFKDGALRNAKGEPFVVELLDTVEAKTETTTSSWRRALEKLGIELRYRIVDYSLYQERLTSFSFEMTGVNFPGTHFPGAEYADLFGTKAADTPDSGNLAGIKSPAVDMLIQHIASAEKRSDFLTACRALDRVIAHGHHMVPAWTSSEKRVAYSNWRLERPAVVPPYPPEGVPYMMWPMTVWWARTPAITEQTASK
jgi:microcin C transport system substrate-binding protein